MPSYHWIKLYHEILRDPKMGRLPDRAWRRCIEIFLLAGENGGDGSLPPLPDIAWTLRVPIDELQSDIEILIEFGILREVDDALTVVNFARRQAPFYRSDWWQWLRLKIMERDEWTCQYCGAHAQHIDHVIPRCQGGSDNDDNLVASCAQCNLHKSGRTPRQARMVLRGRL